MWKLDDYFWFITVIYHIVKFRYCLDTLCNITSKEVFEEEQENDINVNIKANQGEQFTEMFLKNPENLSLVLGLLEEYDFRYVTGLAKF